MKSNQALVANKHGDENNRTKVSELIDGEWDCDKMSTFLLPIDVEVVMSIPL